MEKLLNKVTCSDCFKVLESLPDNYVDAVITDPPYSSGGLHSGSRQAAPSKKYIQTNTQMKRPEFIGDNKDQRAFRHSISMKDKKYHITAKPIGLMEQLVQICPPDGILLDPFAGSGTTALACIKTGRNFIAVEKTQEYTEIANSRLQEYNKASHIL